MSLKFHFKIYNNIKKDIESISNIKVSEEKIRQLVNKLIDLFIIDEVEP